MEPQTSMLKELAWMAFISLLLLLLMVMVV
jgi:hypothetical protein